MNDKPSDSTSSVTHHKLLINGQWCESAGGTRFESINPYTGEVCATFADANTEDVHKAISSARVAFDHGPWGRMNGYERGRLMLRLADLLEQNVNLVARTESIDNGKLIRETTSHCKFAVRSYRFFAGIADKLMGDVIPLDQDEIFDYAVREPLGVCGLILSWNSPMSLMANKLAPALAAGNTVVVKPSEYASASTVEFARIFEQVGFPPGVFNVVTGFGSGCGQALTSDGRVDLLSLTGGLQSGRAVGTNAAQNITKLVLELGGKSPHIVFSDADLERAVPGVMAGIFGAAGQTCIAGSRLLIQDSIYDEFLSRLVDLSKKIKLGNPLDTATEMGPLANQLQLERVQSYVNTGRASGATLACGGHRADRKDLARGYFFEPSIFVDATNQMQIARDEIFGPVLTVLKFHNEAEALQLANDSDFGLASGFWTSDIAKVFRMSKRLRSGTVWVNTYRQISSAAPFGGYKKSGTGRERGLEALRDYTQVKNVMIDYSSSNRDPFSIKTT